MPSPITQILGSAMAQVAQPHSVQHAAKDASGHVSTAQALNASQASAGDKASAKVPDEKRVIEQNKVQGAFVSRRVKPKRGDSDEETGDELEGKSDGQDQEQSLSEERDEASSPRKKGLDVMA